MPTRSRLVQVPVNSPCLTDSLTNSAGVLSSASLGDTREPAGFPLAHHTQVPPTASSPLSSAHAIDLHWPFGRFLSTSCRSHTDCVSNAFLFMLVCFLSTFNVFLIGDRSLLFSPLSFCIFPLFSFALLFSSCFFFFRTLSLSSPGWRDSAKPFTLNCVVSLIGWCSVTRLAENGIYSPTVTGGNK